MADWTKRFALAGRTALVTGATKGIGIETAKVLADAGADIAAVGRDKAGLEEVAAAVKTLGADAERVQVLFITLDPERDAGPVIAQYVRAFDPGFLALRGDLAATQRVAKDFKIYFEKRKQGESYTIDHSSQLYVMDRQGRLRLLVRHDRIGNDLASDLRTLLQEKS